MKIYRFHWDCGRMGDIRGMFVVSEEGERLLRALVGKTIDFGEALGKHSEVQGELEDKDLDAAEATADEVATVCRILRYDMNGKWWATISGYNPLDYIGESGLDFDALCKRAGLNPTA